MQFYPLGFCVPMVFMGDDGDKEVLCEHGVGHSSGVHTCDNRDCCRNAIKELRRLNHDKKESRIKRSNSSAKRTTTKKK